MRDRGKDRKKEEAREKFIHRKKYIELNTGKTTEKQEKREERNRGRKKEYIQKIYENSKIQGYIGVHRLRCLFSAAPPVQATLILYTFCALRLRCGYYGWTNWQ